MNWRPPDWEEITCNKCPDLDLYDPDPMLDIKAFEAGADAMHEADIEWLEGYCDKEHCNDRAGLRRWHGFMRRRDCPTCWREFKSGIGKGEI